MGVQAYLFWENKKATLRKKCRFFYFEACLAFGRAGEITTYLANNSTASSDPNF